MHASPLPLPHGLPRAPGRFVYQAVHMIFNGNFEDSWEADEKRESKLVFIGKAAGGEAARPGHGAQGRPQPRPSLGQ